MSIFAVSVGALLELGVGALLGLHGGRELADSYFSRRDFAFSLSKSRLSSLYLETPSLNQFNFANFSHRFACINSFVCRDQ